MVNAEEIYYRNVEVPFVVLKFTKSDIRTRISTVLNFYEKYTVLILKDKVKAGNIEELSYKVSNMLNVKYIIIFKFIEMLEGLGALRCEEGGVYSLTDDTLFNFNEKHSDIMLANLKEQNESLEYVYFIESGNLISTNLLKNANITIDKVLDSNSKLLPGVIGTILLKKEIGKQVARDTLKKSIVSNFRFNVHDLEELQKCDLKLPVRVEYLYDREKGYGVYSNCELNVEDEYVNKYIKQENIALKIKMGYEIDKDKPDYIILEEQLEKEKAQLERINNRKVKLIELEEKENKNSNSMKELNISIDLKNKTINELQQEIEGLKQETEEYKKIKEEYQKQEVEKKALKEKVEELRRKQKEIKELKSKNNKEIYDIQTTVKKEHEKIITDEFEKKLEKYKDEIDKINDEANPKLYEESISLYNTLLSFSKKINNDSRDLHREWTNLYASYSVYIKVLLCYMLKLRPELFNSIKSIVDNDSATDLGTKFGISIDTCRDLKILETIIDTGRHRVDALRKIKQDLVNHKEDDKMFAEYILSSKENRKKLLLATFDVFLKGKFKEQDYININEMCVVEAERTGKV